MGALPHTHRRWSGLDPSTQGWGLSFSALCVPAGTSATAKVTSKASPTIHHAQAINIG